MGEIRCGTANAYRVEPPEACLQIVNYHGAVREVRTCHCVPANEIVAGQGTKTPPKRPVRVPEAGFVLFVMWQSPGRSGSGLFGCIRLVRVGARGW